MAARLDPLTTSAPDGAGIGGAHAFGPSIPAGASSVTSVGSASGGGGGGGGSSSTSGSGGGTAGGSATAPSAFSVRSPRRSDGPGTRRVVSVREACLWRFAVLPESFWHSLAQTVEPEGDFEGKWNHRVLQQYLYHTFIRLKEQDRIAMDKEAPQPAWAAFNTGLRTPTKQEVVLLLLRNSDGDGVPDDIQGLEFLSDGAMWYDADADPEQRFVGKVMSWSNNAGTGRVVALDNNGWVPFRASQLLVSPGVSNPLAVGSTVEFSVSFDPSLRRLEAVRVTGLGGTPLDEALPPPFVGSEGSVMTMAKLMTYNLGIVAANVARATYFAPREPALLFDWTVNVNANAAQLVADNFQRFVNVGLTDGPRSATKVVQLSTLLYGAIQTALSSAEGDLNIAVPHYSYTVVCHRGSKDTGTVDAVWLGKLQLLLPLYFEDATRPALALSLSMVHGLNEAHEYQSTSVVPLRMAWTSARLVHRPQAAWMRHAAIDVGVMVMTGPDQRSNRNKAFPRMYPPVAATTPSTSGAAALTAATAMPPSVPRATSTPTSSTPRAATNVTETWWGFGGGAAATSMPPAGPLSARGLPPPPGSLSVFTGYETDAEFPPVPSMGSVTPTSAAKMAQWVAAATSMPPPTTRPVSTGPGAGNVPGTWPLPRLLGTVHKWFDVKGFGFIVEHRSSESYFCHISQVENNMPLFPGQSVDFVLMDNPDPLHSGKKMAVDVRLSNHSFTTD